MTRFLIRCSFALLCLTMLALAVEGHEQPGWYYTQPQAPFYTPPPYPFYTPPPYPFYAPPQAPFYAPSTPAYGSPYFMPLETLRPLVASKN